jgi:hypothetical protein
MKKNNRRAKIAKGKLKADRARDANADVPRNIPDNMRYVITVMDWDDQDSAPTWDKFQFKTFEEAKNARNSEPKYRSAETKIKIEPKE